MPIPEERLYKPNNINLWFAASSVIMTASILWMIWIDYDRPWRKHQDNFYLSIAALAHLDYLDSIRDDRMQEIEDAETRLKDARDSSLASERAGIVGKLADDEGLWFVATTAAEAHLQQELRQLHAVISGKD